MSLLMLHEKVLSCSTFTNMLHKRKRGAKDIPLTLSNLPIGTDVRRVIRNNRTRVYKQPLIPSQVISTTTQPQPSNVVVQDFPVYEQTSLEEQVVTVARTWKVSPISNSLCNGSQTCFRQMPTTCCNMFCVLQRYYKVCWLKRVFPKMRLVLHAPQHSKMSAIGDVKIALHLSYCVVAACGGAMCTMSCTGLNIGLEAFSGLHSCGKLVVPS